MATTIYKFQSDLTGLIALNKGLKQANTELHLLKVNTIQYAAMNKKIAAMANTYKANTSAIHQTTGAVRTLNANGNKMVAIFKSASIAIVAAFAFRAIIGGITGVIKIFANFEKQMDAVRAISGATEKEFTELKESAEALGRTTVFTAMQVAELQEEFGRLGFTVPEILAAQQATLNLAAATGENLSSAAAIAGSSIRAFEMDATQVTRVTNVMGESFTGSALNLERFTQSMKFAAPVARTAGFTIEETSAMLMILADAGLHGSIAGNALKNIFLRLGDANSKLNQSIGHTVQGLPQLIEEMKKMSKATFGLTDATELLDKRSAPAFLVLLRNIDELELRLDTLNKAEGSISEMAQIRLDNLAGDFTLLKSASEGLGLAIGDAFDFQMRKAIQSLTDWVQALAENPKAIDNIRRTMNALATILKLVGLRFAILKTVSLASMVTFKGVTKVVRPMALAFKALTTSTRSSAVAFRTLRTAMASTGFGAIVVAVGALVGYMMDLSDAGDEAAHSMDRLNRKFNDEIDSVTKMNEVNSDRHDKVREIVSTYKDLLQNADIEILNNQEMVKLQTILNDERVRGNQINATSAKARIKEIEDEMKRLADLSAQKITQMEREQKTETRGSIKDGTRTTISTQRLVKEEQENLKRLLDIQKGYLDEAQENFDNYSSAAKKNFDELTKLAELDLKEMSQYRLGLRNKWLLQLEQFRRFNHNMQKETVKRNEQKLEDMEQGKRLAEQELLILEYKNKNETELLQGAEKVRDEMEKNSSKRAQQFRDEFLNSGQTMLVKLSEYKRFVSSLTEVLEKSGTTYTKKSALSGARLQNTKNRLKELMDIQVQQINDTFKREMAQNLASFEAKKKKYEKEEELIVANINSIDTIMAKTNKKQIIADIKANKNKYQTLKTLDEKSWNRLMSGKGVQHDEYMKILQKMMDEEVEKQETNEILLVEIKKHYDNEKKKIEEANTHKMNMIQLETNAQSLRNMDEDAVNMFSNQKKKLDHFKANQAEQQRHEKELLAQGEITKEQFKLNEMKREQDLTDFKRQQNQERLQALSDTYSQIADMIMSVSANIAAVEIQELNKTAQDTIDTENNKHERKLEIAEAAGQDTEAMQRAHDNRMEAIEKRKDEKVREVKRKQFMLEKANNIAMALINGAQAIAKVTAQTGIGAIAAAPLTSALIAAQIGTILSQKFVGAKGGIIPSSDEKFALGGMVEGPSHAQGGVKFAVGGRVAELEGGEAVINKKSTAMFRPQLSAMNAAGGGVRFEKGGITPGTRTALDNAKGTWTAGEIAGLISGAVNSQQVIVTESDITSTQTSVSISEGLSNVFK